MDCFKEEFFCFYSCISDLCPQVFEVGVNLNVAVQCRSFILNNRLYSSRRYFLFFLFVVRPLVVVFFFWIIFKYREWINSRLRSRRMDFGVLA